jgi:hypothetical protein
MLFFHLFGKEWTKMNLINETVFHTQFGSGVVTEQTMTRITIKFGEEYGIKKFSYPHAFGAFLELADPAKKHNMQDELRELYQREEQERRQRAEVEERRLEAERQIMLEQKRASSKKKSSTRKAKMPVSIEKGKD